ncbi:signal transduction histidine kinase/phage shock protein PspC (stress-responsive transcriptional regulator) [Phycicoccus badiiscoriae]|uniref:Signal transduction histidine kinase/phage shock protein PspC (Stress-responsive transcriptional regulator) n=1 Tax=Pedococcus badiiscoriae TaxID=642776 RepID=A0A852WIR6_9MICO|nr:ATP-binding protein [Pedococcus badiiscoriae]NYG07501.1 signal transduction histidine kinase/phage shock protein PspC (stress-responsive transcriptional regulator) [Pedococcus badiiscoriae]
MPTPYERPVPPAEARAAERRAARPTLTRPVEDKVIAGVSVGLAQHLGWPVRWIRLGFVLLSIPTGAGLVAYVFLWALTPQSRGGMVRGGRQAVDPADAAAVAAAGRTPSEPVTGPGERDATRVLLVGGLLLGIGLVVVAQNAGLNARLGILVPLLVVAAGAVLAWSQLDDSQRGRWLGSETGTRRFSVARLAFGGVLALTGLVIMATRGRSLAAIWDIGAAVLAVLAGVALIAAPWALRLWSDLRHEQAELARATERADIAAHLHDSVLQTLALIQRKAGDAPAVTQLARAQERELRSWLYAGPSQSDATLATAVVEAAHEVEDLHGIPIDVVSTGDRPLDEGGHALVRAVRESLQNAVRHGAPPVSLYLEVGPAGVEAFVRDHGPGFELGDIPPDRLGVRQSVLGRMERHGGRATVRRLEQGTEVSLSLPPVMRPPHPQPDPEHPQPASEETREHA